MRVGERGQVTIPKELRERYGLTRKSKSISSMRGRVFAL